jgi:hypothetical protein
MKFAGDKNEKGKEIYNLCSFEYYDIYGIRHIKE